MSADAVGTLGAGDADGQTAKATNGLKGAAARWAGLSERQRALLVGAAAAELSLKIAALVDIARRPASQIRGPKVLWRAAMAVNLLGPLSYFLFGRRG
jgi:Phospholipase_D-nuclease N-terminal